METQSAHKNGVTFKVAEVTSSTKKLSAITVREAIDRATKNNLIRCPHADLPVIEAADFHPLIAAAATAFKQHYPLVLSPDMLWLTILQGVAQHVANHSDSLRSKLAHHETKIELIVDSPTGGLPTNDEEMLAAVNLFTRKIEKHIQPDKKFLFQTEFSTTTAIERIAMSVVLMDTFQPYFDYVFACICGIPAITLEGTPEDWELLESKVQTLHESDLDLSWWTEHLLPLCRHFVRTARNDVDTAHWNDLLKLTQRYGVEDLNGWLLRFIPYVKHDKNEPARHKNPLFEFRTDHEEDASIYTISSCTSNMLPSGISDAPVTCWNKESGEKTPLRFIAGFGGVHQSPETLSLRPLIIWGISSVLGIEGILTKLQETQNFRSPYNITLDDVVRTFRDYLPGDLWKFYSTTNGLHLSFQNMNQWDEDHINIKSISEISPVLDKESIKRELKHLLDQGFISPNLYQERLEFIYRFGGLLLIGEVYRRADNIYYVFGDDIRSPSRWLNAENETEPTEEPNQGQIFRWDGRHTSEGFVPVARNFTQWLEQMVAQGVKPVELDADDPQPS